MRPNKSWSLMRVVFSQAATSRNIREGWLKAIGRFFWVFALLAYSCWRGASNVNTQTLGDIVRHNGEEWWISNWAGSESVTLCGVSVKGYKEHVPQSEFVVVKSLSNLWHRYFFYRDFYRDSWLGIEVNKRLYPEAFTGEPFNV